MNALLFMLALTLQTHTPTAAVSGDVVTVSADFAYVESVSGPDPVVPVSVTEGVVMAGDYNLLASADGVKPVAWQLEPGTYRVTAFGYPDNRALPMRTKVVLDVTVLSPTRQQQIVDALKQYAISSADTAEAIAAIKTLKPSKAELAAAFTTP